MANIGFNEGTGSPADGSLTIVYRDPITGVHSIVEIPVGVDPVAVAVDDLDGGIFPDAVIADEATDQVHVVLSERLADVISSGGDPADAAVAYSTGSGSVPSSVAIDDVDGDGHLDLMVALSGSDQIGVLLGVGDGSFRPIATFDAGSGPASLQLVDVNGDGDVEAVVTNEADNEISVIPEPTALAAALAALLTMAGLRRLQARRF